MATEIIMPKLGMGMKEGTVVEWRKNIGDPVQKGEIVVVISSEKIEFEVESTTDGVLLDIVLNDGGVCPYGTVIGYIGAAGEQLQREDSGTFSLFEGNEQVAVAVLEAEQPIPAFSASKQKNKVKISPVARKMAEEAGLDPESLIGSGPQGRITKEDVEKAIADRTTQTTANVEHTPTNLHTFSQATIDESVVERIPVTGMRKIIAARMHESLQKSAQLTMNMRADVSDLLALMQEVSADVQARYELKLTITDFIARAVVLALLQHKQMNSAYIDETIYTYGHVHLGIAVALEKGLIVPVIHNADRSTLIELSRAIKSLGQQARDGQLSSDDITGSTFTITNLGAYGIETFTPVLNPPEAGILGVGAIQETPVYHGETVQRRSLVPLSLTFDHRVLDGAPAAQFLSTIKRYLEHPHSLLF